MTSWLLRLVAKIISCKIDHIIAQYPNREPLLSWMERNHADSLASCFDSAILESTYIVETETVPDVPIPSIIRWFFESVGRFLGYEAIDDWNHMADVQGITLKNTIFIHKNHIQDTIVFHELVHVLQWRALGDIDFIVTYALQLIRFSYDAHPLEDIAYDWENRFLYRQVQRLEEIVTIHALEQRKSVQRISI